MQQNLRAMAAMGSSPTRHDLSQKACGIVWNWNVCGSEL